MDDVLSRALALWTESLPDSDAALELFRQVYADPLVVNGVETPLTVLVERSRMLQTALAGTSRELVARVDGPDAIAFAFRIAGEHAGPLVTPIGDVAATGRRVEALAMDIFELADGLVTGVWAVADYLGLLVQTGAVTGLGVHAQD